MSPFRKAVLSLVLVILLYLLVGLDVKISFKLPSTLVPALPGLTINSYGAFDEFASAIQP